jgi:hypothetical protein
MEIGAPAASTTERPRKSLSCDATIVTAMPAVNPVVTG